MTGPSKQTTTQNTSSEPWAAAQPAMKTALGGAQSLYDSGIGGAQYGGSTVTPFSQQSTRAMGNIEDMANANSLGGQGISKYYDYATRTGGYNAQQMASLGGLSNFANGGGNVSTGRIDQIGQQATGPSYSERNLSNIASGGMLNRQDPNFERALSAASESAANQINLGASGAGRYGSTVHQGNVAREIGNYEAGQRVNQYNTERQNQMAANQMMDSQRMQGLGLGLGAAGQSAGLQSDNYSRQMAALQNQFNAGQQGFNNLGAAYEGMKAPQQDLLNVGSMYEDLASRLKNDEIRMFEASQNAPWEQLLRLNAVASGAGAMGGTTAGQAQAPGQSPLATGLGYATGLASLFGGR